MFTETMKITLFGITKELVGNNKLSVDASVPIATVGELKCWLSGQYPALKHLKSIAIAVDSEYADDAQRIYPHSDIALIPPVSGG